MFRRVATGSARSDTACRPSGMGSARGPMRTASKRGPRAPPTPSCLPGKPTSCTSSGPPSSYRGGDWGKPACTPPLARSHPKHHIEIKFFHLAALSPFRICPQASADWVMASPLNPTLKSNIWLCHWLLPRSPGCFLTQISVCSSSNSCHLQPCPSPQSLTLSPPALSVLFPMPSLQLLYLFPIPAPTSDHKPTENAYVFSHRSTGQKSRMPQLVLCTGSHKLKIKGLTCCVFIWRLQKESAFFP